LRGLGVALRDRAELRLASPAQQLVELLVGQLVERVARRHVLDRLDGLAGWDSLAALSLVSVIDDEYGVVIGHRDFVRMETLQDIYDFIQSKR
jgi:acyl carrier protein